MALTQPEQIKQLIDEKKHILVTFRKEGGIDAAASALALKLFLEKKGKVVDIVSDGYTLPKSLGFLKKADTIQGAFSHLQKFIVILDVKETGVQELSYDLREEKLRIFITPKQNFLTKDHVRTAQTDFKYDLIFVLDTEDLASLGSLYDNNTELFYKTPVVNMDHRPGNEHFGQINVLDLTATSTAEVVFDTLLKIGAEYIDADIATALLTGMIANTHSFKTESVKPHTLSIASQLITLGANRETIVHNLYRTKSISTLKLWGHALTHLRQESDIGLVSSTITREDFVRSGAVEEDLKGIIEELISNSPEAKITLLLHEHMADTTGAAAIHVMIHVKKGIPAKVALQVYHPRGSDEELSFTVTGKGLKVLEDELITALRNQLQQK